jgi:UDP-N-acetylglucosamine--N-acetylmuramyl-(pentapeptide) pyrophosphoryl-undecaprenol N-acetylglucosamine transferase
MTTLLVASTGGHLADLFELAQRMNGLGKRRLWVTFDNEHGRTLLAGENKVLIPSIAERDVTGVLRGFGSARRIMRTQQVTAVVSTGSAIALSFLPYAALRGIEAHYIECSARVHQPSLTGQLLQTVPGVRLYRQYPYAAKGRWRYGGSVFDGFQGARIGRRPVARVVVTLGTMEQSFRRLIERVAAILPPDIEVLWQTGSTPIQGLGIEVRPFITASALAQAMREADVVIAHSGCGSALMALKAGKCPVLVARDPRHGEVVDGHQVEITRWLNQRDLALARTPDELTFGDLETAAARAVVRLADPPPFQLSGERWARA